MSLGYKRPNVTGGGVSETRLPDRGSSHPAFIQMGFSWGELAWDNMRYKDVTLPDDFVLRSTVRREWFEIRDGNGYPRARVYEPSPMLMGALPFITPVRRFDPDSEPHIGGKWKMVVREWGRIFVRGKLYATEKDAILAATSWLDETKSGWADYVSDVNFSGRVPEWKPVYS